MWSGTLFFIVIVVRNSGYALCCYGKKKMCCLEPACSPSSVNRGCSIGMKLLEEKHMEDEEREAKRDNTSADYQLNVFFAAHMFIYTKG